MSGKKSIGIVDGVIVDLEQNIFQPNPSTVIDKATFEKALPFSEGIEYVIVNGVIALENDKTIAEVFSGRPDYGKYRN